MNSIFSFSKHFKNISILLFTIFVSTNLFAQNFITVPFSNGFVGNNTANNSSDLAYYTSGIPNVGLGWTNVQFAQNSTENIFVAQGNDIIGMVLITDFNGVEHTINGFVKWRTPSGNSPHTLVFQPATGTNVTLATNSTLAPGVYTINETKYIGLTFNGSTLDITPIPGTVTGNAATNGLLDALNAYLATFGKLSVADISVNEGAGTATVTVTLSTSSANTVTVAYATSNGTATSGLDYTATSGTLTFAAGQTTRTFTIPIINDAIVESDETINITLSDPTNASILDGAGVVTISDNDSCALSTPAATVTVQPTCATTTGTIVFTTQSGVEYSIDGTTYQSSATFTAVAAGSYTLTVRSTSDNTCTATGSAVTVNAAPSAPSTPAGSVTVQPTCATTTGTIVFTTQSGVEYSIDGTTYQSSATFTAVAAGSYTLTVRSTTDNTCIATGSAVTVNAAPSAPSTPAGSVTVQPTCATTTGTIVFTTQSGVEYSIDGTTYQSSATFTAVAAGSYTLTVRSTSDNTCTATGSAVTVNAAPSAPSTPAGSVTVQPTCAITTGTIVFTTQSGVEYSIDGTTYQSSATFTSVAAGSYTLTVRSTSDNTCTATGSAVTVNAAPSAPSTPAGSVTVQPTCAITTGTIVFTTQSGVEYSIDGTTYQSSATFTAIAAGSYTLTVRSTTDNTCTATGSTVKLYVPICAITDTAGPINGLVGATTASVLTNDTLNGVAVIPSAITLTGLTVPTGLTLNPNGTITISPNTPAGTLTLTYRICENLNPTNCDTATVTITVAAAVIDAVADTFGPINGYTGSTTASVLVNDTLNGVAVIPSQVVLTGTTVPTGLTLNANGTITISPLTPAGTYSVIYKICEVLNPTNCDTVTTSVTISATVIDAVADTFEPINGYTGSTTASVLANDTLNGVAVIPSQVVLTGTTVPTGLTLNANGTITIAPLTPAGTYSVIYKICEVLNSSNCDTVTTSVTVGSAVIDAVADTFGPINGYTGSTTASVLVNDTLNGVAVVPSQVVLTGTTVPTGLTLNANGTITIAPLTPAGTYSVIYKICEVLNPSNCDTVTTSVTVGSAVIDAVADTFGPINGYTGSTTASVLVNDTLNGVAVVPSQVVLTGTTVPIGLTLNANGTITIAPLTPAGTYSVIYKICEVLNSSNCDTVTTSVSVGGCLDFAINDCDNDGESNGTEIENGTNPNNPCSYTNAPLSASSAYATWSVLDCDGDGTPNGSDLSPKDPCIYVAGATPDTTNPIWSAADCDNDGESNGTEIANGTNPNDSCSYTSAPLSTNSAYSTWSVLDCDGDGTPNGSDLNPKDPCIYVAGATPDTTNPIWAAADCDNDGGSNGTEIANGTNPNDPCSYTSAPLSTSVAYATWSVLDCDGDGTPNGSDLSPKDPCIYIVGATPDTTNPIWAAADCDNDGESNGNEITNGTNPNNPCSYTNAPLSTSGAHATWSVLDCDGDGVTNAKELMDNTNPNNPCESKPEHITNALSASFLAGDCDSDGLTNEEEIGSNVNYPNDPNGNGIPDYLEINNNTPSEDDLEIFNAVTPNGNGDNDVFVIRNIENYPNNTVTIFNRWGVVVYETEGYGQSGKFFKGISEGRSTINKNQELPIGNYFFVLRYVNNSGVSKERSGYLYLNK